MQGSADELDQPRNEISHILMWMVINKQNIKTAPCTQMYRNTPPVLTGPHQKLYKQSILHHRDYYVKELPSYIIHIIINVIVPTWFYNI